MSKTVISTPTAPKAIGPYSQGIKANGFIFVSGQLGIDPATGNLKDGIEAQTLKSLENIGEILKAGGASYSHIVKTTLLLKDINDFGKVNQIYETFFQKDPPARATYAVAALPKGGLIEIEAVALSS